MLTEETAKQTNFFKREGDEKVYLVVEIRAVKLATLIDTIEGCEAQILLDDEEACRQFVPVQADFKPFIQNQITVERPATKQKRPDKKAGQGGTRRKDSTSQFRGVREDKRGYSDGRRKWVVNYYNPEIQKVEYLGSFDNEYLAAATYEERAGNKAEAARLRAMVKEYEELNPDRPLSGSDHADLKKSGKTEWLCKRCGLRYLYKGTCAHCGNDDMREVPAE
jgi:hypothetical protein